MVHKVYIGKEKHAEVAEQFQVKDLVVQNLMKKVRQDKSYLKKTFEDEMDKAQSKKVTIEVAKSMKDQDSNVFTSIDI